MIQEPVHNAYPKLITCVFVAHEVDFTLLRESVEGYCSGEVVNEAESSRFILSIEPGPALEELPRILKEVTDLEAIYWLEVAQKIVAEIYGRFGNHTLHIYPRSF